LSAPPLKHFALASQECVVLRLLAEHRFELLVELDLDSFAGPARRFAIITADPSIVGRAFCPPGCGDGGLVAADGGLEGRSTIGLDACWSCVAGLKLVQFHQRPELRGGLRLS